MKFLGEMRLSRPSLKISDGQKATQSKKTCGAVSRPPRKTRQDGREKETHRPECHDITRRTGRKEALFHAVLVKCVIQPIPARSTCDTRIGYRRRYDRKTRSLPPDCRIFPVWLPAAASGPYSSRSVCGPQGDILNPDLCIFIFFIYVIQSYFPIIITDHFHIYFLGKWRKYFLPAAPTRKSLSYLPGNPRSSIIVTGYREMSQTLETTTQTEHHPNIASSAMP